MRNKKITDLQGKGGEEELGGIGGGDENKYTFYEK